MFNFSSMKRLCTLSIVSGALVLVSLHFTGCSKTPTIDPVVDLPIGVTLSDQGFTASDGSTGHFSRTFMSGDQAGLFSLFATDRLLKTMFCSPSTVRSGQVRRKLVCLGKKPVLCTCLILLPLPVL